MMFCICKKTEFSFVICFLAGLPRQFSEPDGRKHSVTFLSKFLCKLCSFYNSHSQDQALCMMHEVLQNVLTKCLIQLFKVNIMDGHNFHQWFVHLCSFIFKLSLCLVAIVNATAEVTQEFFCRNNDFIVYIYICKGDLNKVQFNCIYIFFRVS